MDRLAVLFGRHRSLLACCVLAYTGLSLFGLSRLTFHEDPLELLKSDKIKSTELDDDFAHLEHTALIVVEGEDLLTPQAVDALRDMTRRVTAVNGVQTVYSMLSLRDTRRVGRYLLPLFPSSQASAERFARARRRASSHPLLVGHLLSEDATTLLVVVQLDAGLRTLAGRKEVLDNLQATLAECTQRSALRARLTGATALEVEIIEDLRFDIFKLSFLGASLVVVIAVALFRRIGAALLVAVGPAVGAIWTMGTLGLIGVPINMLTNVVPLLVLVIGFTDSMHLVLHVRRALAEGSSALETAQSSLRHLALACALTSLSTAVGFGSLMLASLSIIRTFGWCCALGSVLSFFAVITVVPLLASTPLSRYVVAVKTPTRQWSFGRLADRLLGQVLRRPRLVLLFGAALTLALALLVTRLEPDHSIAAEIPPSSSAYQALRHVDQTFGGTIAPCAMVQWPQGQGLHTQQFYDVLEEVHQVFDRNQVLSHPLSILNLVRSLPGEDRTLARRAAELRYVPEELRLRLVSPDQRRAIVSVHMPDVGVRLLKPALADVQRQFEQIARRHPGFQIELAGSSVSEVRSIHLMIEDLWKSLSTAACVMFLMIWVGLRSFRYALVSILPNAFPLLCTGAFIVLSGRYLEMSSVVVFSISLGVAVDDTIHFLVRFKREIALDAEPRGAVRRTFMVVGKALVLTTLALVAGHSVVIMSSFPAIQVFGMLTAITIASALLGDLVFLPAILVCLPWPRRSSATAP